jgi:hypothetical protein
MRLLRTIPYLALILVSLFFPAAGFAQEAEASDPASALSAALSAACRADPAQFEKYLTVDSAVAFHGLPDDQKAAFLKRFSLSEEAGKPLASVAGAQNLPVVRCEAPGGTAEFRFGNERVHDNLAYIRVDVVDSEQITFGLVRQDGAWRLVSLGLVTIDVPQLAKQWEEADLVSHEAAVVSTLKSLADAVETYRRAYGKLPDSLAELGPAPKGEISPELADLVDDQLASGSAGGYRFRYRIASSPDGAQDSAGSGGFEISATPGSYGKGGRESFFRDAAGVVHGADKHGEMAAASDPEWSVVEQPSASGGASAGAPPAQ